MKTVTFYSYKGGVGRTLLLANVAKYLARFGQKVFAMDFDLEAPGLHYKLDIRSALKGQELHQGVVDYIHSFVVEGKRPASLEDFTIQIPQRRGVSGIIHLMPAGNVPTSGYWRRLAQISWHNLFYSEGAKGIPFFLDLKARIQEEFAPDYLLIDSRTGITEIGGVATTVFPDYVVCLLLRNRENLEGAREVLRSIKRTIRIRKQHQVKVIPVVTRLPVMEDSEEEKKIVFAILQFLNQDAPELEDTLSISELSILHTDRRLEIEESLLIDSHNPADDSPLLRDYIRLFAQLIPKEDLDPYVGPLVNEALIAAWDDPVGAERDLIALFETSAHPETFDALIKFYRMRKAEKADLLRLAYRYWERSGRVDDPLLINAVRENFIWEKVQGSFLISVGDTVEASEIPIDFIGELWRIAGADDANLGVNLAQAYIDLELPNQASEVILNVVESDALSKDQVSKCLEILLHLRNYEAGIKVVERFRSVIEDDRELQFVRARLIAGYADSAKASEFLQENKLPVGVLRDRQFPLYARLLMLAGRTEEAKREVKQYLRLLDERVFGHGYHEIPNMRELAYLSKDLDYLDEFISTLRERVSNQYLNDILIELR